jgi:hypothetical protein
MELKKYLCTKYNVTMNIDETSQSFIYHLFYYRRAFSDESVPNVTIYHYYEYDPNKIYKFCSGSSITSSPDKNFSKVISFLDDIIKNPEIYKYLLKEQKGLLNMYKNKLNNDLNFRVEMEKLVYHLNNCFSPDVNKQIVGFLIGNFEIEGHIEDNNETILAKIISKEDFADDYHFIKNTLISRANYLSIKHLKLKQLVKLSGIQYKEVQYEQLKPMLDDLNLNDEELQNSFGRVLNLNAYLYYYHSHFNNVKSKIDFINCINEYITYIKEEFNLLSDCIKDTPKALEYITTLYGQERFQEFHEDLRSDITILSNKVQNFQERLSFLSDGRCDEIPQNVSNYLEYLEGRVAHCIKTFDKIKSGREKSRVTNPEVAPSSNKDISEIQVKDSSSLEASEEILDKNLILPCLETEEFTHLTNAYDSNIEKQDNLGL